MAKSLLSAEHFHDEAAALAFIEARLWPNGPSMPALRRDCPREPDAGQEHPVRHVQVLRLP